MPQSSSPVLFPASLKWRVCLPYLCWAALVKQAAGTIHTRDTSWLSGPSGQKNLCFWGQKTIIIRKTVRQSTTPRALHRQWTRAHLPSACVKGPSFCPETSTWGTSFWTATHLEASELLSENTGRKTPSLRIPLASPQLPGKGLIQSSEALIFATDAKETLPDLLAWNWAGPMTVVTQDYTYLYSL